MSFTHAGQLRLIEYEEVELEITGATLIKRRWFFGLSCQNSTHSGL